MTKKVLLIAFTFVLVSVSAQDINPMFWKNYSRVNPSYVNTDTTHYSDLWLGLRTIQEDFNSPTGFLTEVVSGLLHNYTLKNGKTNIGESAQYNQIGGWRLIDFKLRGSHQFGNFNIGLAAAVQRFRLVNIITDIGTDPLQEDFIDASRYRADLDLGANYSNNGLVLGLSATGLLQFINSDGFFGTTRYVHILAEKELEISEFVKITPYVSAELTRGTNSLVRLGARTFFNDILFAAYTYEVNAHHVLSVGGNIKKKMQLGYGVAIPTNNALRQYISNFHQLNLSFVID